MLAKAGFERGIKVQLPWQARMVVGRRGKGQNMGEVIEDELATDRSSISSALGNVSPATPASGAEVPSPQRL